VLLDSNALITDIDSSVLYSLGSVKGVIIPIRKILTTKPVIHIAPSDSIANNSAIDHPGSVGCIVTDKNNMSYVLTCFHCVIDPSNKNYLFDKTGANTVSSPALAGSVVGNVYNAIRNNFIDAAIVGPIDPKKLSNFVEAYGNIKGVVNVYDDSSTKYINSSVLVSGNFSKGVLGTIQSINYDVTFDYRNGNEHELQNLIVISNNGNAVSEGGDSGAPVLDLTGNIIGIIVGGNDQYSYAIPIQTIFYYLKVKL
jgi:hypothetical protein